MSKDEKLLAKLMNDHGSFPWPELVTLLRRFGYRQIEESGSRVEFDNGDPAALINLHKSHPGNKLKAYIKRLLVEQLRSGGLIP